jgi:hypothetical protein
MLRKAVSAIRKKTGSISRQLRSSGRALYQLLRRLWEKHQVRMEDDSVYKAAVNALIQLGFGSFGVRSMAFAGDATDQSQQDWDISNDHWR